MSRHRDDRARHRPAARHRARGFTLVEILVATVIVGLAVVAASWAMSSAVTSKAVLAERPYEATLLAREIHELARALPREPSGVVGVTSAAQVLAIDSLVGATFSPPIRADGSLFPGMSGWTQDVSLALYDMDDLTTPTADDPRDAVPASADLLYKLRVRVLKDGSEVDTFEWWIAP